VIARFLFVAVVVSCDSDIFIRVQGKATLIFMKKKFVSRMRLEIPFPTREEVISETRNDGKCESEKTARARRMEA